MIASELKSWGLEPRIDSAGNVVCEVPLKSERSLLLCGHMDTVPGALPAGREGSIVRGRGAVDAKGALMSLLFAFEDLSAKLRAAGGGGHLIFAGVVNEEGDSSGLNQLVRDGVKAECAIFGEPGGADKITVGYRGHLPLRFEVETPEVHASAPWLAPNSIEVAVSLYERLKELLPALAERSVESDRRRRDERVSLALTQISGGSAHNVAPGRTRASVDIRVPFGLTTSSVRSRIEAAISEFAKKDHVRISAAFGEPTEPYRAAVDSEVVRALSRALIRSGRGKPTLISKSGTGDMNTYALAFGAQAVTYGPGDAKLSHTVDEALDAREVLACADVVRRAGEELLLK
jgi:LysW-gamma-L-lysine carboxypeptidase